MASKELERLLVMPPEERWQKDPIGWAEARLGIPRETIVWSLNPGYENHEWDGTPDPLAVVCRALADGKDAGVESATGTGKTFLAAVVVLWFVACFENALVVTTAPKEDQLTVQLWKEIGRLWPKFKSWYPMAYTVKLRVRMKDAEGESETWGALGLACGVDASEESANRARGFHAKNMLIITEETPGVANAVMTAFANTSTGLFNLRLALGNPDNQQDSLHRFCLEDGVVHVRISGYDHPNVVLDREMIPGAVTRKSLDKMRARLSANQPLFDAHGRGICPAQSVNALFRSEWIDKAFALWDDPSMHEGPRFLGVDVANSEDGDKAAFARGKGRAIEVEPFPCPDANDLGDILVLEAKSARIRPQHVGVDADGIGAATVNQARRLGFHLNALHGGVGKVQNSDEEAVEEGLLEVTSVAKMKTRRSAYHWQLREDLERGRIALKPNDRLKRELLSITWALKAGIIMVESKEDLRDRIGRSPDEMDAVVYANWVRPRGRQKEEESEISAFSPEMLKAEYEHKMRFRTNKRRQPIIADEGRA